MSNKINHLAYNKKLSILVIHFLFNSRIKTLVKSMGYKLCPLINIIGNRVGFGSDKLLSGMGFAKLSTSVGMGTYKQLHINSSHRFSHA